MLPQINGVFLLRPPKLRRQPPQTHPVGRLRSWTVGQQTNNNWMKCDHISNKLSKVVWNLIWFSWYSKQIQKNVRSWRIHQLSMYARLSIHELNSLWFRTNNCEFNDGWYPLGNSPNKWTHNVIFVLVSMPLCELWRDLQRSSGSGLEIGSRSGIHNNTSQLHCDWSGVS